MATQRRKSRRKQRRWAISPVALVAVVGALLLLAGVLFLFTLNRPPPAPAARALPASQGEQGIPSTEVPRTPLVEARARYDAGTALFVDVRSRGEYETAHIPDAISLPLAEMDTRYQELPRDAEIITYCTWPNEESSARAARILLDKGYINVSAILGGLRAWQQAGYPTVSS